ncbi:ABC transporter ATP-binding protein [Bacillus sp. NPDC077027]|uniref:ABC transporter ATP-binding protein n=1 Tax=Bacillus sp. NPDC077027 TaxID=3390548 RepID=UPI003D0094C9
MDTVLTFEQASYWNEHQIRPLFEHVNYSFKKGAFYTIVGASGVGKTTFLSIAGGLDHLRSGAVRYKGLTLSQLGLTHYRKRHVSTIFQAHHLIPYMTALQNVTTAMEIKGSHLPQKEQCALHVLKQIGIDEAQATQRVLGLSSGQKQRVAIARAICCDTDIFLADDPTANLDDASSRDIVRLFEHLAHDLGKCILMVTHDEQIARISDVNLSLHDSGIHEMRSNHAPLKQFI